MNAGQLLIFPVLREEMRVNKTLQLQTGVQISRQYYMIATAQGAELYKELTDCRAIMISCKLSAVHFCHPIVNSC